MSEKCSMYVSEIEKIWVWRKIALLQLYLSYEIMLSGRWNSVKSTGEVQYIMILSKSNREKFEFDVNKENQRKIRV